MSIKNQLRAAPEFGKEITGHDLMALERFAEDISAHTTVNKMFLYIIQ